MVQLYKRKGADVLVNTVTLGNQLNANVSLLAGGGFVIVWTGTDSASSGIRAQRFDAAGNKLGAEFLVNTTTSGAQSVPVVAGLPSGRFVITWTDASATGGDTSSNAVRGQLFEVDGTAVGSEFLVNTQTANSQNGAGITELAGGGFVISWTDASLVGGDNSISGVKAQLFDANGVKVGGEILLNTEVANTQNAATLAALPGGGFVATWQSFQSGTVGAIKLQLFDGAGVKVGTELTVNAVGQGSFTGAAPVVTVLAGGFVVAWAQQDTAVASGVPVLTDIHAQRFDMNGNKVGTEFVVNTTNFSSQSAPDVDQLPGGGFIVTWQGPGVGTSGFNFNIYGQIFDASGNRIGAEFLLTEAPGTQGNGEVEVLPSGDIVIVWTDNAGDSSGSSVWMQTLTLTTDAPTDLAVSAGVITETAREGEGLLILTSTGAINSTFAYAIVSDSTGGAFGIEGDRLVVVDNSLLDFVAAPQVQVRIRTTDLNGNSYEETLTLDITATPDGGYAPTTGEFVLSTTTDGDQTEPVLVALSYGGFLASWRTAAGAMGQFFDADGTKLGGEFSLDNAPNGVTEVEDIVALDGGFATVGTALDGSGTGIIVTFYDEFGTPTSAAIPVNTTTANEQSSPSIALLSNGNLLVTWTDFTMTTFLSTVRAQILDQSGAKVGTEFGIPNIPTGSDPEVTTLADGGFVVTWTDGSVHAQMFAVTGARIGPELTLGGTISSEPHVVALADGGFAIVYSGDAPDGLYVQIFDTQGRMVADPVLISANGPSHVHSTAVAALPWGGFVVAWTDKSDPGEPSDDDGIRAQAFDATGAAIGDQMFVNVQTLHLQIHPDVIVLDSGDIVIGWTDSSELGGDTSGYAVKARIFILDAQPTAGPDTLTGTADPDTIDGLGGDDVIDGRGGDDVLNGGAGSDEIEGGGGDDTISGGADQDFINGGDGNDILTETGGVGDWLYGGSGDDELIASAGLFRLFGDGDDDGQDGNDQLTLTGGITGSWLVGGGGNDIISVSGSGEQLVVSGDAGNDEITVQGFSRGNVNLGDGDDILHIDSGYFTLQLDDGRDEIEITSIGAGFVTIIGFNAGEAGDRLDLSIYGADPFANGSLVMGGNGADVVIDHVPSGMRYVIQNVLGANLSAYNLGVPNPNYAPVGLTLNAAGGELVGADGDDVINGSGGDDRMFGGGGDDDIAGGDAADFADGGSGEDMLLGQGGDDGLLGGLGDDYLDGGEGNDSLHGGDGIDGILGNVGDDFISGGDGNDSLHGQAGVDTLIGGAGNDFLSGGEGVDVVYGGTGDDIYISDTLDYIVENAGEGFDLIYAAASYTLSFGQEIEIVSTGDFAGTNAIDLGGNELNNILWGNAAVNVLSGFSGNDSLHGFGGNDGILGGTGDDFLDGGDGDDSLFGDDGNDTLAGGAGNDFFAGGAGIDIVYGGAGDDIYVADAGDYIVEAIGGGSDLVYAMQSFTLSAGQEIETLAAGGDAGGIYLGGNELANNLWGNGSGNILNGGGGEDVLIGYGGNDIFAFTTAAAAGNADTIVDFTASHDRIALDDGVFAGIGTPGAFNAAAFVAGTAALDANDRIIYNAATGQLFYDADGNAAGAAVLIATLQGNPVLGPLDFMVI